MVPIYGSGPTSHNTCGFSEQMHIKIFQTRELTMVFVTGDISRKVFFAVDFTYLVLPH